MTTDVSEKGLESIIVRAMTGRIDVVSPAYTVSDAVDATIRAVRQYQTRMIADVVTGQLDVREAVKRLPPDELDIADAQEPLDEEAPEEDLAEDDEG